VSTAFAQPPSDQDQCQNGAERLTPGFALRKEPKCSSPADCPTGTADILRLPPTTAAPVDCGPSLC